MCERKSKWTNVQTHRRRRKRIGPWNDLKKKEKKTNDISHRIVAEVLVGVVFFYFVLFITVKSKADTWLTHIRILSSNLFSIYESYIMCADCQHFHSIPLLNQVHFFWHSYWLIKVGFFSLLLLIWPTEFIFHFFRQWMAAFNSNKNNNHWWLNRFKSDPIQSNPLQFDAIRSCAANASRFTLKQLQPSTWSLNTLAKYASMSP